MRLSHRIALLNDILERSCNCGQPKHPQLSIYGCKNTCSFLLKLWIFANKASSLASHKKTNKKSGAHASTRFSLNSFVFLLLYSQCMMLSVFNLFFNPTSSDRLAICRNLITCKLGSFARIFSNTDCKVEFYVLCQSFKLLLLWRRLPSVICILLRRLHSLRCGSQRISLRW